MCEDALGMLLRNLVAVRPSLDPATIRLDSSLTADLGLDSRDLVELAGQLADAGGPRDLAPWLSEAMRPGGDTVGSLAAFLAAHPAEAGR
jgi:acyl carrier protein